ncbi:MULTISPECIES: ATP-binding protein [unclassified Olleya]|jgi:signal transduction histidine kinase/CheY-like chemotaxis protein|uniref:ATP-binding protein n=1 Tax=unclassified Olleya TaxID=2615019 RepID=UPI00119F799E|nr:ATP-binding protein [Olleya sp. Hel_I_94]TVZ48387.1 phospho-acceptor domain-containing protein [Olleya sp. Hel_I_94]
MLEQYKKEYSQSTNQYIVVDLDGKILESDDVIFTKVVGKNISTIHPFFESIHSTLLEPNQRHVFSCIHLTNPENQTIITDIIVKTFDGKQPPLVVVLDLTTHYDNYQTTAQVRNESVINSQILELKNEYLQEKEAFKNAFIANFSHELRDPLTGILTFSDILKKTHLSDEQLNYLKVIDSSSTYLKQLIEDILDISKIEAGKLDLVISPFDIRQLLEDIKSIFEIKAQQKGLELITNFNDNLPEVVGGDPLRLRQVLSNLLENAIKFTEEGTITFNVSLNQIRAQKASIHFQIIDTGIGIPQDKIEDVFTSFTQLNNSQAYKGAGLGLAIAKHLVSLTHSKISVDSTEGEGSTFSTNINFSLDKNHKLKTKKKDAVTSPRSNKKYSILLVEDSEITQLSILKILASRGNYFLDIVTKGEDVIPRIENSEFDLILMDIKLPNSYGDEITKLIRKMPEREHKKIPVIALTARVMKDDLKRYKKAGINDVIQKPFDENALITKIEEYLK